MDLSRSIAKVELFIFYEINVEVFSSITVLGPGPGKALLLTAILPGLGLTKIEQKPYWIWGVLGYSMLYTSMKFNSTAAGYADDNGYVAEEDWDSFSSKRTTSKILGYSALGIWAISMIRVVSKAKKVGSSVVGNLNKKQKVIFYSGINPNTKSLDFTLKYSF